MTVYEILKSSKESHERMADSYRALRGVDNDRLRLVGLVHEDTAKALGIALDAMDVATAEKEI